MFSKKKKKPQISLPSNFEHRVHTGFDKKEGRYIGLPLQWASIVGNNQVLKSSNRPMPVSLLLSCVNFQYYQVYYSFSVNRSIPNHSNANSRPENHSQTSEQPRDVHWWWHKHGWTRQPLHITKLLQLESAKNLPRRTFKFPQMFQSTANQLSWAKHSRCTSGGDEPASSTTAALPTRASSRQCRQKNASEQQQQSHADNCSEQRSDGWKTKRNEQNERCI